MNVGELLENVESRNKVGLSTEQAGAYKHRLRNLDYILATRRNSIYTATEHS